MKLEVALLRPSSGSDRRHLATEALPAPRDGPSHGSPNGKATRGPVLLGVAVALAFLVPALALLPAYGPTWDCVMGELPFGERLLGYLETGDERFLDLRAHEPVPVRERPHPDFDGKRFRTDQVYPLAALASALSCRLLWTETGLVPAMAAHHLPILLLATVLVGAVTAFAARRLGPLPGVAAGALLALSPRFFADSFNNLKDVPVACLYTLACFAGFKALSRARTRDWVLTGTLTGLALATKVNALFVPVVLLGTWGLARLLPRDPRETPLCIQLRSILAGGAAFVLAWFAASPHFWSAPLAAPLANVRQILSAGQGHSSAISLQAPLLVLVTTPVTLLVLATIGASSRGLARQERCFLLVGVTVAVGRNLLPGMRNYDGVRHFLEFLPPLAVLGAAGIEALLRRLPVRAGPVLRPALVVALLLPGAIGVAKTHPHGTTYFNVLAGGLEGARAHGIPDAVDYWASSLWQGCAWLSAHAERDAHVVVPVGLHVARSIAPVRLRRDLSLSSPREGPGIGTTYVLSVMPRRGRGAFGAALERERDPVHEIRVQGARILAIYRLDPGARTRAWDAARRRDAEREPNRRLITFAREEPETWAALQAMLAGPPGSEAPDLAERIRALVPPDVFADLELALRHRTRNAR